MRQRLTPAAAILPVAILVAVVVAGCGSGRTATSAAPKRAPTSTTTPRSAVVASATPSRPTPAPAPLLYTVRSGDTLSKIAQAFGVSLQDLIAANNITDANRIAVGQQLIIPAASAAGAGSARPTTAPPTAARPRTAPAASCWGGCTVPPAGCRIKGNVSFTTAEKIYHVPGGEFYDATEINPSYGERWFCSEDEARAAGWRRSYR